jgi:hypothetical protein
MNKALNSPAEKLTFLVKRFGVTLTSEFIDASKNIDAAFKQALYAEYVVDEWMTKSREALKCN